MRPTLLLRVPVRAPSRGGLRRLPPIPRPPLKLTLQLVWTPDAPIPAHPDAWFFAGNSSATWLDNLVEAGIAQTSTRLFLIPRSNSDPTPAGILAVPKPDTPRAGNQVPRGMPYQCLAGRVYVPAPSRLHPPVSPEELTSLCPWPIGFFHPQLGFSGLDHESTVSIESLLIPPHDDDRSWNRARPGPAPLPELKHLDVLLPDRHNAIFGNASEEIGTRSPKELPPAPNEPQPGALARLLRGFFPHRSSSSSSPGSSPDSPQEDSPAQGGFFAWIRRQLGARDPETQAARHRELDRLIHLLDSDPDAGLRHALSLANSGPSTSAAPPGTTLPPHPVDFQLDTLSGGPGDAWDVPPKLVEILQLRYRELADRELRLGRFRRAAYIYAHLLGDFASATHALKKGGHFKEAAILYETQLNNPLEAARCFAAGGHVDEAIERFEQLECWLELAELHQRLGHTQAAQAAFRREADQRLRTGNPLGASEILADTLGSPDEALAVLDAAWPHSSQSFRCIAASFERRAHLGRHLDSLKRLGALASPPPTQALVAPLAQTLVHIARTYPDPRVRHQAADLIRVLVGRRLSQPTLPLDEARPLVDTLIRLAPEDRLLARDANRHLLLRFQTPRDDARTFLPSRRRPPEFAPKLLRRIRLRRADSWIHLVADGPWFFAVGRTQAEIIAVRGLWTGTSQDVSWDRGPVRPRDDTLLVGWTRDGGNALLISRPVGDPFPQKPISRLDWDDENPWVAGTPSWLPAHSVAVALGTHSRWCAYRNPARRTILVCLTLSGDVQQTVDITDLAPPTPSTLPSYRVFLAPVEKGVAIAHHDRLDLIHPTGRRDFHQLPSPVIGLVETPPFGRPGVIAVHETGAVLRWANRNQGIPFAEGFAASLGVFLRQNQIILVSADEWRAFRCEGSTVQHVATRRFDHPKATAICTTSQPDEFAVLDADGVITVYQVTSESDP